MNTKILIADDDPVVRHLLSSVLSAQGYAVQTVDSGQKCLDFFNTAQDLPELLFLDLQLPDMTGAQVVEILRQSPSLKDLPIVMLSANTEQEVREKFPDLAITHFLEKPFPPDKVGQMVQDILSS